MMRLSPAGGTRVGYRSMDLCKVTPPMYARRTPHFVDVDGLSIHGVQVKRDAVSGGNVFAPKGEVALHN